jgi:hypothetical protein
MRARKAINQASKEIQGFGKNATKLQQKMRVCMPKSVFPKKVYRKKGIEIQANKLKKLRKLIKWKGREAKRSTGKAKL